jgi:hypothetical protein
MQHTFAVAARSKTGWLLDRSVWIGSTCVARSAGTYPAISATDASTSDAGATKNNRIVGAGRDSSRPDNQL